MSNPMNGWIGVVALCLLAGAVGHADAQATAEEPLLPPPEQPAAAPPPEAEPTPPSPMYQGRSLSAQAREEYENQPEKPDGYDLSRFRDRPKRHGFTLELGLGLSLTHISGGGQADTHIGLSPLSLSLGGFVSHDVAVMFRLAGSTWFADDAFGDTTAFSSAFYGPVVQWWIGREVFVAGGIGLGVLSEGFWHGDNADTGPILTGRLGYSFYTTEEHSIAVVLEVLPAFYDEVTTFSGNAQLQWQLL